MRRPRIPHPPSLAVVLTGFVLLAALPAAGQILRPVEHIIVIILDDVGVDMLPCYGEGTDPPTTPNLCALAAQGALFRNAWANPTCSPTRATIQTGRYSFRTGVTFAGLVLPAEERTIPEILADPLNQTLGFATAAIGKWHLSGGNANNPPLCPSLANPQDQGYDYAAGTASNLNDYFHWCRTVNGVTGICTAGGAVPECTDQPYATTVNVNDALKWIGTQTGPWFLWMAFNAPHSPFQAPPAQCPTGPCHSVKLPPGVGPGDVCPAGEERACYEAMLETLDTEVGRLLAGLPKSTAVILLGDNGSPGQVVLPPFDPARAKFTVYEGGINVPLVARLPGLLSAGTEVAALVNTADLFATVLDLAGAVIPPDLVHDSVSLVPILQGSASPRTWVFSEHRAGAARRTAARQERYKLMRMPNSSSEDIELYDLLADPFETQDLYDDAQPSLTTEQQEAFDDLQEVFDFLDGVLAACPGTRSCQAASGSCQRALPLDCTITALATGACVEAGGSLFQCPPEQTIHLRNCTCEAIVPGSLCPRTDQSWFCG